MFWLAWLAIGGGFYLALERYFLVVALTVVFYPLLVVIMFAADHTGVQRFVFDSIYQLSGYGPGHDLATCDSAFVFLRIILILVVMFLALAAIVILLVVLFTAVPVAYSSVKENNPKIIRGWYRLMLAGLASVVLAGLCLRLAGSC